jgi:hypothetical protein
MPSILTHQYFANQLIERYQKIWPFLVDNAPLVWVGAQGPDPFFFYGRAPLKKRLGKETINQFGSKLHNQNPTQSLLPLLQHAWFSQNHDDALKAYMFGALSHYVLDRTCHPYVFYRSGFDEQGQLTGRFSADHARLEVEIDIAIIQKFQLNQKIYQPKETLRVDGMMLSKVSEAYRKAFPKVLAIDTFRHAVEDMQSTYRFLYHGPWLNRLIIILIAGRHSLPFSLIHPTRLKDALANQALNITRKKWHDPVTNAPAQKTFMQLFEDSLKTFEKMMPLLKASSLMEDAWQEFCEAIDYDGKKVDTIMRFQQPYQR